MKYFSLAFCMLCSTAFGQQSVQVIDSNGNVSTFVVRSYDLTPVTIPIKPYGLNLKPANVPERKFNGAVTFDAGRAGPGAITIENPYFRETDRFPEPENNPKLEIFLDFGSQWAILLIEVMKWTATLTE